MANLPNAKSGPNDSNLYTNLYENIHNTIIKPS